jgi:uncharacterized protein YecE (DUF72 family)
VDVWIGTSGYSYPDWVGTFYPAGTRPNRMLGFYATHFPVVELNFTFYHPPTPSMLARMAEPTPETFQFVVKIPRTISHECRRDDLAGFRGAAEELQRRGQLLGVLAQLPQSAHDDPTSRAWVETIAKELQGLGLAIEFRHLSWAAQNDLAPWLAELGADLVSVDVPDLPGLFPPGLVRSGPHVYVRLHSRAAANWYGGDKDRYDYDYSTAELGEWVSALAKSDAERALVLFNNCQHAHAPPNALHLRELCGRAAPRLRVVGPFVAPAPVQRTLFD